MWKVPKVVSREDDQEVLVFTDANSDADDDQDQSDPAENRLHGPAMEHGGFFHTPQCRLYRRMTVWRRSVRATDRIETSPAPHGAPSSVGHAESLVVAMPARTRRLELAASLHQHPIPRK